MTHRLSRRSLLRSGIAALGCALPGAAWPRRAAAAASRPRSLVLLWMNGGPSHIDTFDPKPGTREGGSFKAIATRTAGLRFAEHLPRLAEQSARLTVVRSLTSKEGNHVRAQHLLHTSYAPNPTVVHPSLGGWISKTTPAPASGLPAFVAIGGPGVGGGFLGAEHGPFVLQKGGKAPPNLRPPRGVDDARFARRRELLAALEGRFALETGDGKVAARGALYDKAATLMASPATRAFDLASEPERVRVAYGDTDFGRGCLVARRLVEQGVPCVEVVLDGWDTHVDNFDRVAKQSATLDAAFSALLDDLAARELLATTAVVCLGEFGRTPRINERGGRDHHPAAFSAVLAGGAFRPGPYGETDATGGRVVQGAVSVPDFLATVAVAAGLDPSYSLLTPIGRPIAVTDGGRPVAALLAPELTARL